MGFFDGNTLSSRATAQLSYDGGFDVADKKLRHGLRMLSLISFVKLKQCETAGEAHQPLYWLGAAYALVPAPPGWRLRRSHVAKTGASAGCRLDRTGDTPVAQTRRQECRRSVGQITMRATDNREMRPAQTDLIQVI